LDAARSVVRIELANTVNADPAAHLRLLDLQAADTALAQLAHRRRTLPELAAIRDCDARAQELEKQAVQLRARDHDIDADERRLENEIETVRSRAARDDQRLTAGGLPAKELEGLQHEIATLARRQSALEDDVLELMEQREGVERELAAIEEKQTALSADRESLVAARDAAFAAIDATVAERTAERATIAGELPGDLLALYDKVRAANGGVGAAALRQRRCEGCRIELAGTELINARTSAADAVLRCENCRRILIRTADSGL
jgi:predicted  nucleic acid-binding Zn-ribbon protein